MTHLGGSGLAAKYSAESAAARLQGRHLRPDRRGRRLRGRVATGRILWQYKANLDQTISAVCCGWVSRGVALGDGKVYIGQLDGNLVALDQQTGRSSGRRRSTPWQQGYSITTAPLYFDGRVITGVSGGEFGSAGA